MSKSDSNIKGTQKNTLAGYGKYLRFTLKHSLVRYIVWIGIIVFLIAYVGVYYKAIFKDPAALRDFQATVATPGLVSMVGKVSALAIANAALCSAVWAKIWMFSALTLGIGMVFQITKGVRADEENGRTEIFRSRPFGIHSTLAAVVSGALILCAVIGILSAVSLHLLDLDPDNNTMTGPIAFGLSVMAVGWLGVGIGALSNQLSASSSIANSTGSIILAIFYIMRMMGDLGTNDTLTWISPLGWAQKMAPWGENRFWLLIPNVILTAVLIMAAFVIEARRDYGSGVLKDKTGHPDASPLKRHTWGLILHLYKGSIIGWTIGVAIFGLLFGSVVNTMMSMLKDMNVPFLDASSMDSMVGFMMCFIGLVSVLLPMLIMIGLRTDETKGLMEAQLAGSVSRYNMVLERYVIGIITAVFLLVLGGATFGLSFGVANDDISQIGKLALDALIYLPGIMAITSVTVLLFGFIPRATIPVTWFIYGLMYFAVLLIDQNKTPKGVIYLFPFLGTPKIPGASFDPIVIVYLTVAILFVAVGMFGLRKRDVPR